MRVLITGSRTWTDPRPIRDALDELVDADPPSLTVVHGAASSGADQIADRWAVTHLIEVERHPADWEGHGKRAGVLRNVRMVEAGADLCLAFIRDDSKGATHCATAAEKAGIESRVMTWDERTEEA